MVVDDHSYTCSMQRSKVTLLFFTKSNTWSEMNAKLLYPQVQKWFYSRDCVMSNIQSTPLVMDPLVHSPCSLLRACPLLRGCLIHKVVDYTLFVKSTIEGVCN